MSENNNASGKGSLIVKASTASGAIPLENVTVVIQGLDSDNSDTLISLVTDRDGITPRVELSAPPTGRRNLRSER